MSEPVTSVATLPVAPETPHLSAASPTTTTTSSASSVHSDASYLSRPPIGARKPSGTIIVPRDAKVELELGDEVFDEEDARTMSPRRNSEDLERMSQEAREELLQYVHLIVDPLSQQFLLSKIMLRIMTSRYSRNKNIADSIYHRHAKMLHESLLSIFIRIEAVKEEHDKLDSNNKFLQKYIGDLMSTSKITAIGAPGRKK